MILIYSNNYAHDPIISSLNFQHRVYRSVSEYVAASSDEVFEKISPAVEHNYSLLMNTDWDQHMINQVQQKINQINCK